MTVTPPQDTDRPADLPVDPPAGHPPDQPAGDPRTDTWLVLAAAAELVAIAVRQVARQAEATSDQLGAGSLSLGIDLLQGHICQLVPVALGASDGPEGPGNDLEVAVRLDELTAVGVLVDLHEQPLVPALRLLQESELLLRRVPVGRADLVEVPGLVIGLCDLIREARTLGT